MIAVSSFRPMLEDDEVTRNQISAAQTWWDAFDQIIYLGDFDARLSAENVCFFPCEGKPTIRQLAQVCSKQQGWTCIVNADIHIANGFRRIQPALEARQARAAVSWRFQFDGKFCEQGMQDDWGDDWFAAKQDIWEAAARAVPDHFFLGRILWDTWMLGFFASHAWGRLYDISPSRMIFHPRHTIRVSSFSPTPEMHDAYVMAARWPTKRIVL